MSVDGVFPPIAQDLIGLFGRDTTLLVPSTTPIDPARPDLGNVDSSTEITVKAVWKRFLAPQDAGEVYEVGDVPVLVAAADLGALVPPTTDWRVTDDRDGKVYSVVTVGEVAPGNDRVLYELVLRG